MINEKDTATLQKVELNNFNPLFDQDRVRYLQSEDLILRVIIDCLNNKSARKAQLPSFVKSLLNKDLFPLNEFGILQFRDRLAIPVRLVHDVLRYFHESCQSRHSSFEKCLDLMKTRVWWYKWATIVREFVNSCNLQ